MKYLFTSTNLYSFFFVLKKINKKISNKLLEQNSLIDRFVLNRMKFYCLISNHRLSSATSVIQAIISYIFNLIRSF